MASRGLRESEYRTVAALILTSDARLVSRCRAAVFPVIGEF